MIVCLNLIIGAEGLDARDVRDLAGLDVLDQRGEDRAAQKRQDRRDGLGRHGGGVVEAGELADLLRRAELDDHREGAVVHQRHAEALEHPHGVEQHGERELGTHTA